jgi:three-Cys-motif partner protein
MSEELKYDEVGYWSEIKLDIIKEYATEYSKILNNQKKPSLFHIYIDAFAGAGMHISKRTGDFILGSPLNALDIKPPFREYHLIDLDGKKINTLKKLASGIENVFIYKGDCNKILLEKVLKRARYEEYKRALCILDPYGMHLNWEVIHQIGQMESIDIFLNFAIADMNRNVLRHNQETVLESQIERMNLYWGDESWRKIAYIPEPTLFGPVDEKTTNKVIVKGYIERLKKVAGFKYIPEPIAMRNTIGAVVYYLIFASQKPVAKRIVEHIFNKYKGRMG